MNESILARAPALLALILALLLGACADRPSQPPPLQGATMGGPFTLTDQNGQRVSDTAFAGKYRLVYFGFTFCPDVCPTDMQVLGAGLRQFEASDATRGARVQPIFISVDPARDTPPVLRQFVANFHPRFVGLTGSAAEVAQVARAYGIFYDRGEPGQDGAYLVNHSRTAVLYGPQGEPIALIPQDQGPAAVAAELDRWVR
jgi:protein SCO1/2